MATLHRPGDWLSVTKEPAFRHHGIYIGQGEIAENSPRSGKVRIVSLDTFSGGKNIQIHPYVSEFTAAQIVQRARGFVGRPYSLLGFNCEHFVKTVIKGKPSSDQVTVGFIVVGLYLAFKLFAK